MKSEQLKIQYMKLKGILKEYVYNIFIAFNFYQ